MTRLSRYLLRAFSAEALALFGIALFMIFLIQVLIYFDLVVQLGQNVLTVLGLTLLGMPALTILFLYICIAIGLGRALRGLQLSNELQTIHAEGLLPALIRATGLYILGGTLVLLVLSHLVDPWAKGTEAQWRVAIAADLVSRSMVPHKFADVTTGVSLVIGARDQAGNIEDFFADDHRDPHAERTYTARHAILTRDEQGYVLRLQDGAIQYMADGHFSEIAFARYDLALDALAGPIEATDQLDATTTPTLVARALAAGQWDTATVAALFKRSVEGLRVIALCVFVFALAGFPSGNRTRRTLPIELAILAAGVVERTITSYVPAAGPYGFGTGSVLLLWASIAVLAVRLRPRRIGPAQRVAA